MIVVLQPNQERIPMATITQVAESFEKVFGEQVEVLARESGFIQRQVTVTGSGFVQAMALSFQGDRSPSYSEISQSASSLGMPMRERIRANAEALAKEAGVEIEFARKKEFRKERGEAPSLVILLARWKAVIRTSPGMTKNR